MLSSLLSTFGQAMTPILRRGSAATAFALLSCLLVSSGFALEVDAKLLKTWFAVRGPRDVSESVSIVRYEKHLKKPNSETAEKSSLLRQLANAIDVIAATGAKMIVLDFIFTEQEVRDADVLARSLAASPSVLGMFSVERTERDGKGGLTERSIVSSPSGLLKNSAKEIMDLKVTINSGIVRSISLHAHQVEQTKAIVPLLRPLRRFISSETARPSSNSLINYYGEHLAIPNVSLAETVAPKVAASKYFNNRVVFIGEHGIETPKLGSDRDTHLISASQNPLYGVEIHATIAANLLDGSWIRRPSLQLELFVTSQCVWLLVFVVLATSRLRAAAITTLFGVTWLGYSYYVFIAYHYFLPGLTIFGIVMPIVLLLQWIGSMLLGVRRSVLVRHRLE